MYKIHYNEPGLSLTMICLGYKAYINYDVSYYL